MLHLRPWLHNAISEQLNFLDIRYYNSYRFPSFVAQFFIYFSFLDHHNSRSRLLKTKTYNSSSRFNFRNEN